MKTTLEKFHVLTQEPNATVEDCHQYIHEMIEELKELIAKYGTGVTITPEEILGK